MQGALDITPLLKATKRLDDALAEAKSDLEKTGAIQCFEYCYELAWKTMKRILAVRGIEVFSPKEVFRASGKEKLIEDVEMWLDFVEKRNLTVHTYEETLADELFEELPEFQSLLHAFINKIRHDFP